MSTTGAAVGNLKWDSSALKTVELRQHVNFDDAFAIVPIKQQIVDHFNFVIGIVPVLHGFVARYAGKKIQRINVEEFQVTFARYFCLLPGQRKNLNDPIFKT